MSCDRRCFNDGLDGDGGRPEYPCSVCPGRDGGSKATIGEAWAYTLAKDLHACNVELEAKVRQVEGTLNTTSKLNDRNFNELVKARVRIAELEQQLADIHQADLMCGD